MAVASVPMEPVFAVVHDDEGPTVQPAPQKHGLGPTPPPQPPQVQGGGRRVVVRRVLGLVFFLAAIAAFAVSAYHKRHSARDLALVIVINFLTVVLGLCFVKLRQLRGDHGRDAAEVAVERRRVKIAMWVLLVALSSTVAVQLTFAVHGLAPKLIVWGVTVFLIGLKSYFLFRFLRKDADAAVWPATDVHGELSPEEEV